MPALTVYLTNTNDSLVSTARQLTNSAPASETSAGTTCSTSATGWIELLSQGGTQTPGASEPAADGKGWIWDVTTLEGQQISAGNWTPSIVLASTGATGIVADIVCRAYVRSSGGTYTQIGGDMTLAAQSIKTKATFAFAATSLPAKTFNTGDKLYVDFLLNISQNALGGATITVYQNGGANEEVITPGYGATPPNPVRRTARPTAAAQRSLPPWPGKKRREKLTGTGLTAKPVVRHTRVDRQPKMPLHRVFLAGFNRRSKPFHTGLFTSPVVRRARLSRQPKMPLHRVLLAGRRWRTRLTGTGLTAAPVVPPHRNANKGSKRTIPPLLLARKRRLKLTGLGQSAAAGNVRRSRFVKQPRLPFYRPQGRGRRTKYSATGLAYPFVLFRHRNANKARSRTLPPFVGKSRRRKIALPQPAFQLPRRLWTRRLASRFAAILLRGKSRREKLTRPVPVPIVRRTRVARARPWVRLWTGRRWRTKLAGTGLVGLVRVGHTRQARNAAQRSLPPRMGRFRRSRHMGLGQTPAQLVRRARLAALARARSVPPAKGKARRLRLTGLGLSSLARTQRHRNSIGAARRTVPPQPGRRWRRKVTGLGLKSLQVVRRSRIAGTAKARSLPPQPGRRRRLKLTGLGLRPIQVIRRSRLTKAPRPSAQVLAGRRWRRKLTGRGLVSIPRSNHSRLADYAAQRSVPPRAGRSRRTKPLHTGLVPRQVIRRSRIVRHALRTLPPWPARRRRGKLAAIAPFQLIRRSLQAKAAKRLRSIPDKGRAKRTRCPSTGAQFRQIVRRRIVRPVKLPLHRMFLAGKNRRGSLNRTGIAVGYVPVKGIQLTGGIGTGVAITGSRHAT